jgi:hypothetical protein
MTLTHWFPEKNNMYNWMKNKKHSKIVKDYDKQKNHHLEKLASKMLKGDEKLQQLKGKNINPKFLNLF